MMSILILTYQEERNIEDCLRSVSWCPDVVVLDSLSTDRTTEIATKTGARVFHRKFDNFAAQRNWALDEVQFRFPWVFHLDADERFTEALRLECEEAIARDERSGYLVPSKLMFRGKWLKHAGTYPTYQMRLLKIGETRFEQVGHGQREGSAARGFGKLAQPYLHYNFSKGLDDWWEKHSRYARTEAEENARSLAGHGVDWTGLLSLSDPVRRRRALKELSCRLPFRPLLKFLYLSLFRLGFLDGRAGLAYCLLMSKYEAAIVRNLKKLRASRNTG